MPEIKEISTITTTLISGSSIAIRTEYLADELPFTIQARISSDVGDQDGVSYIEGQGLMRMIHSPENISYSLNNNGDLILITNAGDQDNYSIDSNGDLTYTIET